MTDKPNGPDSDQIPTPGEELYDILYANGLVSMPFEQDRIGFESAAAILNHRLFQSVSAMTSEQKTPGQIAFESWISIRQSAMPEPERYEWSMLTGSEEDSWESAAQAVRQQVIEEIKNIRNLGVRFQRECGTPITMEQMALIDCILVELGDV